MATFDYFKAIWKNGPGVVSDAPAWVLAEIDRGLPVWMAAHERELVGVHVCLQSDLVLGILVSPSTFGSDGSLEISRQGSFIHVFATDHPDCATLRVDQVRNLFESTYGAPISDGAVRQQRNFMLLDFPFHQELAKDLFIEKGRVEGGLDLRASAPSSAFEEWPAELDSPYTPHEEPESYPLPPRSLSVLLTHRDPEVPARGQGRLPFDQGRSYAEIIAGMRERLSASSYTVQPERTLVEPPAPERPAVSPSSSVDGLRTPKAPLEVDESATAAGSEVLALSSLLIQRDPMLTFPVADAWPLDQPASARRASFEVEAARADVETTREEETQEEVEPRSFAAIRALKHAAPLAPRRAWSPTYAVAGLLAAGLLVGSFIVIGLWERAPVDASLAERKTPAALIPDVSARAPALGPELTGLDRGIEADVPIEIDAVDIYAPELQPTPGPLAFEVETQPAKPNLPSIEPVMPPVIDALEAEMPVLVAVKTKSAPEAVSRGAASSLEPASRARLSVAPEPVSAMAQVEVATEPEPATEEETSSAIGEPTRAFDPAVVDSVSEPSNEILEQRTATSVSDTLETSSTGAGTGAESNATSIVAERETKQNDRRLKRERKRILRQINRYR